VSGGASNLGQGERQRRRTEGRHCPEPVRPEALENWPAGKRKKRGGNTDAEGTQAFLHENPLLESRTMP
jgi:hypothetical protein